MRNIAKWTGMFLLVAWCFWGNMAAGFEESAVSKKVAWSGYWWPIRSGGIIEPMKKYDGLAQKKSVQWELQNNPPGPNVPKWFGFCHAWSASSVMEPEPRKVLQLRGKTLHIGDQKAWLAASHAEDVCNFFGTRYEAGGNLQDISPEELWKTLKSHIKEQGVPIVVDIEPREAVWNYPVYKYRVRHTIQGKKLVGTIEIWFADDAVPPNFIGLKSAYKKYSFEAQTRNGALLMGTGRWTGKSVNDHPDFLWFPYVAKPENPEVDYKWICTTLAQSLSQPEPQPQPQPQPEIPTISPEELIELVASQKSDFMLDATVDKFDGGVYHEGEPLQIALKSQRGGYLYLIGILPSGKPFMLYPQAGDNNQIAASQEITIPRPNSRYRFTLRKNMGTYHVKAIVTDKPIAFAGWTPTPPESRSVEGEVDLSSDSFHWPPTSADATARGMQVMYHDRQESDVRGLLKERFGITAFAQDETVFVLIP
ncbi:MAG: DUF4384 domain-containing protein [Planctomycetia bacterium]|nr:DUF4384 domain-containing protein [Planctomycetia bacterium]